MRKDNSFRNGKVNHKSVHLNFVSVRRRSFKVYEGIRKLCRVDKNV